MPPDEATYAVRSHLFTSLQRKLGTKIATIVLEAVEREPFDPLRAALTDQAIESLAEARKAAFAAAGLPVPPVRSANVAEKRHAALLQYCADLVERDPRKAYDHLGLHQAAQELHDRVKTFLDNRGQWPILSHGELERNAKPAALLLLEWQRCDDDAGDNRKPWSWLRTLTSFRLR